MKTLNRLFVTGSLFFSVLALSAPPSEIFIAAFGGYTSCGKKAPEPTGIGMYSPLTKLIADIKAASPRLKVSYVVSCFKNEAPPEGQVLYFTSDDPSRTQSGNAAVIMNELEKMTAKKEAQAIYIAGHSYGGYLAMYLMEKLRLTQKVQGLFTIDPIGPSCNAFKVVFGGADCKRAPTDRNNATIRSQTEQWVNFYQDQDAWLHSSAITEAENYRIAYRGPHTSIDSDERTWKEIRNRIFKPVTAKP